MGWLTRALGAVDRTQQRHPWLAFPYAVAKKFGDDGAGDLAALVAYYGFFSLFPLLLVFASVLGLVLRGHADLQDSLLDSALARFPLIGVQLRKDVSALGAAAGVPLGIGIATTLWAGLGVVKSMQKALDTVWDIPYKDRPNFLATTVRSLLMLVVLGIVTVASALAAGVGAGSSSWWWGLLGVIVSLALNLLLFLLAFRILTAASVSWADIRPGAIVGAIGWTALQAFGGYFVGHQLQGASEVYGTFAVVIGLLAWIYLGAQLTLYSAEVNVVRVTRLWPRSITGEPLTEADQRGLRRLAKVEERIPEEQVDVTIDRSEGDRRAG